MVAALVRFNHVGGWEVERTRAIFGTCAGSSCSNVVISDSVLG